MQNQLNVDQREKVLGDYWDTQLLQLLKYGFPLDFNRNTPLRCKNISHSSALKFPDDIKAYLEDKMNYGAILGPFKNNSIENCHYSLFMTREKLGAAHRRVIIDLLWSKGEYVNFGIDKNSYFDTDFILTRK